MDASNRLTKLRAIAAFLTALLFVKVLLAILLEYRWYFPPDFESSSSPKQLTTVAIASPYGVWGESELWRAMKT